MPDVLIATDTKFRAVYDPGTSYATEFVIHGTGLTYTSSGDPAVLLPTGGVVNFMTTKFTSGFEDTLFSFKISLLSIDNIVDMIAAGLDFSSSYGMSNIDGILAGSKIKIVDGSGEFYGTSGGDLLYDNSESNTFDGDSGNDVIYGGGGNDKLYSYSGSDTLFGGQGHDYILIDVWEDPDTQTAWAYGGSGADYLSSDDVDAHLYGGTDNDTLENTGLLATLYGGKGGDILNTNYGVNVAFGGRGNDTFNGGRYANQGTDHLFGGAGSDSFYFGRHDVVTGGAGADLFVFNLSRQIKKGIVEDFNLTKDHIQLMDAEISAAAAAFAEFGAHASDVAMRVKYVSEDGSDTIILKGVSLADLTVDHFI